MNYLIAPKVTFEHLRTLSTIKVGAAVRRFVLCTFLQYGPNAIEHTPHTYSNLASELALCVKRGSGSEWYGLNLTC